MKQILNACQAARIIGCNPQIVRERIKRNIWTFGRFIPKEKTGKKLDSYEIVLNDLCRYLSISKEEAIERIDKNAR